MSISGQAKYEEQKAKAIMAATRKRVKADDAFWSRVAIAYRDYGISYGQLSHEALKRGINTEQMLCRLGV